MKQALKILGCFVGGLSLVAGLFFFLAYQQLGAPTAESEWTWQVVKRKSEIARSTQTNKLLIAGGSSVLFGISAEIIEKETGIPSVNMGTHAALPMTYHLRELRAGLRPGDTALLILEYELYDRDEEKLDEVQLDYLLSRDHEYFLRFPISQQIKILTQTRIDRIWSGLMSRKKNPGPMRNSIYTTTNLNTHGDQTGHFKALRPSYANFDLSSGILVSGLKNRLSVHRTLEEFAGWCRTNRVQLLATFPNRATNSLFRPYVISQVESDFSFFYRSIGVPLLGSISESILPKEEFFDTVYHLSAEGQHSRTQRLVQHLRPFLTTMSIPPSGPDNRPARPIPMAPLPNQ
ncbi:MAG: hypothetical protein H7X97_07730 [Opitutaceae bacterium]|nr:hypothetical protein [Verrucomicrobiales bacterium]